MEMAIIMIIILSFLVHSSHLISCVDLVWERRDVMFEKYFAEEVEREEQEKKRYLWSQVTQESERHRSMKEEYDELRTLLWEEELEEKKRKQEQDERLKLLRLKHENMRPNKEQIEAKKEKLKEK
jgi:hypothetical protein